MKRLAALVLVLMLVLTGCAEPEERSPEAASEAPGGAEGVDAEAVQVGAALAQIRGHHRVALELLGSEDVEGAAAHAQHPIAEVYDTVAGELEEHGGDPESLLESLEGVAAGVADGSIEETRAAADDAAAATEAEFDNFAGEGAEDPAVVGSVVAALLDTAAHEYEEASSDEGIELLVEYQDAYGFVAEAKDLYGRIRPDVEAASAEEAEEIEAGWLTLETALPGPHPPEEPVPAEEVGSAAALIGHELEETVGASPTEEADHAEVVAEIEALLAQIEETYAAGDAEAAAELSAEAYLENYEVIEADVIELAPDLNEELEPLLGAELRRQIQEGASEEEIAAMIERARELLGEALTHLEGAH